MNIFHRINVFIASRKFNHNFYIVVVRGYGTCHHLRCSLSVFFAIFSSTSLLLQNGQSGEEGIRTM
jgi:hypothetical protein